MGATKPLAAVAGGALALGLLAAPAAATAARAAGAGPRAASAGNGRACALGADRNVKHVIYLQFDNTHFSRDNPHVPSDLEQMPNLLRFITGNGTLISHEHTPLIAHTADDIVTSESGLYGDRHGMPVANEYNYYTPSGGTDTAGSFAYWQDPIVDYSTSSGAPAGDHTTTLVGQSGKTPPAPWVSYTRVGCDFGSVAAADTELENTTPDVPLVFGPNSPDAREAENHNPTAQAKAVADYEGLSVHCAKGSAVCAA
ncbi:MAG: hypothetical protein JO242_10650, partial [Streptosporangiaceae bacterium]|nr:hypothetical protein [Streptosporangiaceae bacterium]